MTGRAASSGTAKATGSLGPDAPKWRRRKAARPGEIIAAASAEFAARGFAAARLDDIARQAGVSKGALYLYFETKTDLFGAVVRETVTPNLEAVTQVLESFPGPVWQLFGHLFERLPVIVSGAGMGAVAKMVIAESRNFPDLARVWYEAVVSRVVDTLARIIARAQARGEIRPGDPRLYAMQVGSPILMGLLWAEVLEPIGAPAVPTADLLRQHLATLMRGLLVGDALADWTAREEGQA